MTQYGQHGSNQRPRIVDAVEREALAAQKERRRLLKQKDFTALDVKDVWAVANSEGAASTGAPAYNPEYYCRPWTQLHDEMTTRKVKTVGQLPPYRIKIYRRTTRWATRIAAVDSALQNRGWRGKLITLILVQPWLRYLAGLPERKKQG